MQNTQIPIVSVTGTKGKTTVTNVLSAVLRRTGHNVLHVDTSGHFVNGKRRSVAADSYKYWHIRTVTALPGKYLGEFVHNPELQTNPVAVLECSFSCYRHGLGYGSHNVGVFLNIFEDHLDPNGALKTKDDLAEAKSFIFSAIAKEGYAVFNADDDYVCKMLYTVPNRAVTLVPFGITFSCFDLQKHLSAGGVAVTVEDNTIVLKSADVTTVLCDLQRVPWTFKGTFKPSVMNLMAACAALYGFWKGELPNDLTASIEATRLDPQTGRLVMMRAQNGATVIGDYAHEPVSLQALAGLARTLVPAGGKLIGVVRLSHERPDSALQETGHILADGFDELVVYDKIDGHWRNPRPPYMKRYPQVVGRTSQVLADAIVERNPAVARIIREDEAIAAAAAKAGPDDVVVVILNDDISRSIQFIQNAFKATVI